MLENYSFSVPKENETSATDFLSKRAQLSYVLEAFTLATGKLNLSTGTFASEDLRIELLPGFKFTGKMVKI